MRLFVIETVARVVALMRWVVRWEIVAPKDWPLLEHVGALRVAFLFTSTFAT